jgi:hypothetical protein
VPPTALKARTGEFTPPGILRLARSNSDEFKSVCMEMSLMLKGMDELNYDVHKLDWFVIQ